MLSLLTEEAEAINWYEQRISVEKEEAAKTKDRLHYILLKRGTQQKYSYFI